MKQISKDQITIAYLNMVAARQPEKSLSDALAEAQILCSELHFSEENLVKTEGSFTWNAELTEDQASAWRILGALYQEEQKSIGAKDFAEAMEIDKAAATKILDNLVKLRVVESSRRGRGVYYKPVPEAAGE